MPTHDEVHQLLADYQRAALNFYSCLLELDTQHRTQAPADGEWSVADVLHHMVDSDLHFATRYIFNITTDKPTITPFDESKYPSQLNYAKRSFKTSLEAHQALNATVRDLLACQEISAWDRISVHPERGDKTLFELVSLSFNHLNGHISHVDEILAKIK
jgi:uncharacterized damage-inducible protein DinB